MKKLLFSLALAASIPLSAEDIGLGFTFTAATGNAAQSAAVLYGRQLGTGLLRQVAVDATGALIPSTNTATVSGAVSITAMPSMADGGRQDFTWTTTPVALNLSSTSGAEADSVLVVTVKSGNPINWEPTASAVATPTAYGATNGISNTSVYDGPFKNGQIIWFKSDGSTIGSVSVRKVQ